MSTPNQVTTQLWRKLLASAAVSTGLAAAGTGAYAANEVAIKALTEQAQFWQERGRNDRAIDAWKKLLQIDPQNPKALAAIAQNELDNHRPEAARAYTEKLRQTPNGVAAANRIEGQATLRAMNPKLLEEARTAARTGKTDEAIRLYKQLLGGKTPSGSLALEYYQTLGGNEHSWDEARQGLSRVYAEEPRNPAVALAYAQHLTYRGETRREGIRMLAQLSRNPELAARATESWRKALIWLEASRNDSALFQAYLGNQPSDTAVRNRLESLTRVEPGQYKPDPRTLAIREGFAALDSGDLEQASSRFQTLLDDNPSNTDALGGLGIIRLKQERFGDAEKLLLQASRGQPTGGKWGAALNSARFWLEMEAATRNRQEGRTAQAAANYTRARQLDSTSRLPVLGLTDIAAEEGRLAEAEKSYRSLMAGDPKDLDAIRGLLNVLAQLGRIDEATQIAERLDDAQREKLGGYGRLKGEQLRRAAMAIADKGDLFGAMHALEDALLWDPASPWLRLELARMYQAAGALNEARSVVDGLLLSNPDMPDALYASALMSADAGDWVAGLNYLERIPANSRSKDATALQRRLWVKAQAERAAVLGRSGQQATARAMLKQIGAQAGKDIELLGAVAQAYSDAGDDAQALATIRAVLSQSPRPDMGLRVQYAAILLKTRQDPELASQLRQLYALPMNERQRQDLDKIRTAYSLRQFDVQREAKNLAAAYEILIPLVNEKPEDVSLQMALARLYGSASEYKESLKWYDQVLQREPDNLDALLGASGSALANQNLAYAEAATARAAELAPENASVLAMIGRLYRAQGKTQLATQTFQRALLAEQAAAKVNVSGPLGMRLVDYTLQSAVPNASASPQTPTIPFIPPPVQNRQSAPVRAPSETRRLFPSLGGQSDNRSGSPVTAPAPYQENHRGYQIPLSQATEKPLQQFSTASTQLSPHTERNLPVQYLTPMPGNASTPGSPGPVLQMIGQSAEGALTPPAALQSQGNSTLPVLTPSLPAPPNNQGSWLPPLSTSPAAVNTPSSRLLRQEIEDLKVQRAAGVAVGGSWRARSGDAGTSSLSDFSLPIEGRMPMGDGGHLVLKLTPVILDAGQISRSNLNISQQFGTNALSNATTFTSSNRNQTDSGIALALAYETRHLKVDIGSTPLGFTAATLAGGLSYNETFGSVSLKVDVSRRAVTDSLLSYAGTVDDRTGQKWGGVTATGGRAEVGVEEGPFGVYGYGSYHLLSGKNVVRNSRFEAGAGAFYKLFREEDNELTVGVSLTAMGYDKNLRYFTFGHGGYFSPQRYLSLSLPVEWTGRSGALSYKLDASVGVQTFRENDAPYFPGSSALQAEWESLATVGAAPTGVTWKTFYPGQTKTGLGFRITGAAEYRFAPKWLVGGKLSVDNASNYLQTSGLVYLRYSFEPSTRAPAFPPSTLKVTY